MINIHCNNIFIYYKYLYKILFVFSYCPLRKDELYKIYIFDIINNYHN